MTRFPFILGLAIGGLVLAGCSPADNGEEAAAEAEAPATEAAAPAAEAEDSTISAAIRAAVANPARPDAARARDEGRMPAEILAFYGIEPGMTVLEIGAGGGYYTEILDGVVGPSGKVIAQNSPGEFYDTRIKPTFEPLVERLPNTDGFVGSLAEFDGADGSVDAVFIVLIYHHMHFNADEGEVLPERSREILGKIRALLKPGGILAIIEHAAPDGTSREASAPLHRVDDATTRADITGLGFELAAESDLLHFATDDRAVYWRGTEYQGKTWRLVHKYVKPTC